MMIIAMGMGIKGDLAVPTFLKQWREFRDLTQEQLAERVGLSTPSVSQLENGNQGFTDKSLAAYAKALDCSPVDLLAVDPNRTDSLWPLLQLAERLDGADRQRIIDVLSALTAPLPRLDGPR